MVKKIFGIFLFFVLFFSMASSIYSAGSVEVFSKYNTYVTVNKDYTFDVKKEIYLRNIHDVGIVPGQIEFKIQGIDGENGEVLSYLVTDRYGNPIRSQISNRDDGTVILLDIFTPVLPGFEYVINLDYKIKYESSGFLFKNIQIPLVEKTKIPVQTGVVELSLPDNYYVTYVEYLDENTVIEDNKVSWEISSDVPSTVSVEYSFMPIKVGGLKGSIVFWLTINLILIVILVFEVLNEIKKLKSGNK